jgi:hypothetical protein
MGRKKDKKKATSLQEANSRQYSRWLGRDRRRKQK